MNNKSFDNNIGVATLLLVVLCWTVTCIHGADRGGVVGGLTIGGVKCGQKVCQRGYYCSEYDGTCNPCSTICNSSTHNFEPEKCMKDCQDYIHDQRYQQKDENGSGNEDLRGTVQRLSNMVTVTLTLVCFMLIVLATVLFIQLYRWKKKKNITFETIRSKIFGKKSNSNPNKSTSQDQTTNGKPDLRIEIPASTTHHSDHSPMTTTTSISRKPAEDNALDYAYDNPAMTTSPSPTAGQNENRF